ncbi:hypothetical protein BHE74_00034379 [Ensete ventricosum]|nr:hypothetical protein BHE74_00034379 [Ensete ventricosum]RZS06750.1 hypothetical protein BHM03_00037484 [Ensete ventricosum]
MGWLGSSWRVAYPTKWAPSLARSPPHSPLRIHTKNDSYAQPWMTVTSPHHSEAYPLTTNPVTANSVGPDHCSYHSAGRNKGKTIKGGKELLPPRRVTGERNELE